MKVPPFSNRSSPMASVHKIRTRKVHAGSSVVCSAEPGRGMDVEFKELPEAEKEQLNLFLEKIG